MEQTTSLDQLKSLISLFSANIAQYKSNQYDEANTRTDFIDKFFTLLDWDVTNNSHWNETYRDVIREDKIKIDGSSKAPDYSFRIGGVRKFFVEAKKPAVNIKDAAEPAYQVRRYAYTAKLPLSILTDFEEFAVYDTRIKPNKDDKASVARIFYCTFDEYEQKFDFLYNTFSKNAIFKGSFDKYVDEHKSKRGTSEVDSELLALVEEWRFELAKNIAKNNPDLSVFNLNTVVQRIIDRIVFLRIAEDRGIEDENLLLSVAKTANIYEKLILLFIKADTKYNSGLFRQLDWIDKIIIDDKVLYNIIINLYYPECPYEFSVLPIEILGSIYERFLGKTIRFRGIKGDTHTAIIEEKPEVKKAGGVFYTPQYIVDYIVKNTVGEKIKNKTPDEIARIKICDPACGSGSFLVGAYQYLLNYHLDYYTQAKNVKAALKNARIYESGFESFKLTIEEKQRILTNTIHGVDIDSQAVEVTKLSLYLKLLEDEGKQYRNWLIKYSDAALLPSLEDNIKCGNSLIGSDFYTQGSLDFTEEDRIKVNCFDWEKKSGFEEIFKNGGFDVVIGNPPYVNIENLDKKSKDYFFSHYKTCQGRTDIYIAFIEKCSKNLGNNGILSFIIPYSFTNQIYGTSARENIIKNLHIKQIVDTSNYFVFKSATVKNVILVVGKTKSDNGTKIIKYNSEEDFYKEIKVEFSVNQQDFLKLKDYRLETKSLEGKLNLKDKIWANSIKFEKICFIGYGARLNHKTKNIPKSNYIHTKKHSGFKRFLEGKNIQRYYFSQGGWLDYRPNEHYNSMFPELFENEKLMFINVVKDRIRFAYDNNNFYNSHTVINCVRYDKISKAEHISVRKVLTEIDIEECQNYSCKFLLGILNSNLMNWYFVNFLSESLHFYPNDAKNLPIKNIDFNTNSDKTKHDNLVSLVEKMLELKQKEAAEQNPQLKTMISRQIEGIDKAIDTAVYALYGLSEDEIKVVEGAI